MTSVDTTAASQTEALSCEFDIALSWLELAGILVLLLPAPDRLEEWAYAGFGPQTA